jgi:hypothetical protein
MRRNGLKLNPEKCIFSIRKGQLLGCMVSKRGIQANPQNIEASRRMQPPSSRKRLVQYLWKNGRRQMLKSSSPSTMSPKP